MILRFILVTLNVRSWPLSAGHVYKACWLNPMQSVVKCSAISRLTTKPVLPTQKTLPARQHRKVFLFAADQSLAWLNLVYSSVGTFLPLEMNWLVRYLYVSPSDRKPSPLVSIALNSSVPLGATASSSLSDTRPS